MNSATSSSPRGIYTGKVLCAPRNGRRFFQCAVCGGWVDSNDPQQMAGHEGEAPITAATALPPDAAQAS